MNSSVQAACLETPDRSLGVTTRRCDGGSNRSAGRVVVRRARTAVLGGALLAFLVGLTGGVMVVHPIAVIVSLVLFEKVLAGRRWARNLLIAQQLLGLVLGPVATVIALASPNMAARTGPVVVAVVCIIATVSCLAATFLLLNPKVTALVSRRS